jgi:hypothetical protein
VFHERRHSDGYSDRPDDGPRRGLHPGTASPAPRPSKRTLRALASERHRPVKHSPRPASGSNDGDPRQIWLTKPIETAGRRLFAARWSEQLSAFRWYLLTPHLLRSGLYQAWIQDRKGRQPLILRVRREPFGERVRLWCPTGLCAEDLHNKRAVLRAACRAADIRIIRDEQHSQIVTVDIIRRCHEPDTSTAGSENPAAPSWRSAPEQTDTPSQPGPKGVEQ